MDFKTAIKKLKNQEFDIIYIDPPYVTDYVKIAIEEIVKNKLVNTNTKIIIETDDEERILKQIENINVKVVDKRKYGSARTGSSRKPISSVAEKITAILGSFFVFLCKKIVEIEKNIWLNSFYVYNII